VVYSGSLECIDFGEEGDQKGFCWVELERTSADNRGETTWQFIPVHNRRFISLYIDTRGLMRPMEDILQEIDSHNLVDAIVKVIIQSDEDTSTQIDERVIMAHLLSTARVNYVAAVDKKVDRAIRTRLGANPETLTPLQTLERYLQSKDTGAETIQELLEHAGPLLSDEP
jgi:exonuclease SbcD